MIDVQRYALLRKDLLQEHQKLLIERMKINKRIREVKEEMDSWDRALLNG